MSRRMSRGSPSRKQRGVALLIVLWACTLLAILLGGFAMLARTEGLQARYQFAQTQAHYAAEAGIMRAIYGLQNGSEDSRWIADGRIYPFRFDDAAVKVSIVDEDGKIDLNSASSQVLAGLFRAAGADDKRADALSSAVQDWRSFGDAALPNGAKAPQYTAAGRDYGPRNGPFVTVEELQMVLGMDAQMYAAVAPVVTIWSGRNSPNPAHAPPLALMSIPGMDSATMDNLLANRQAGTAVSGIVAPGVAGGNGVTHSIRAEATLADGTRAVVRATIRLQGIQSGTQPYAVLRWLEGDRE
jgi:general secretion pathway protein K